MLARDERFGSNELAERLSESTECRGSNQNQPGMVELKPATFFV